MAATGDESEQRRGAWLWRARRYFDLNNPRDLTVAGYTEDQLADMTDQDMSDALYTGLA